VRARIAAIALFILLATPFWISRSSPPAYAADARLEWQFLENLNAARAGARLPPLAMSRDVQSVARGWSDYLAATDSLGHNPNAWGQIAAAAPSWLGMGENVASGWSVGGIHQGLMASTSHRNQILGNYNYVGIGVTVRGGKLYVTQDFVRTSGGLATVGAPDLSAVSDGDLVRNPVSGAVFLVEGGAKFWIRSEAAFYEAGYSWASVRDVPPWVIDAIPNTPRDGALLVQRGDPRVYLVQAGAKFWIDSPGEFSAMGFTGRVVGVVPPGALDQVPNVPRDGSLLVERADPRVFVIKGGGKAWIPDPATFNARGYNWAAVRTVPARSLASLPNVAL